jgi:hypothetical protein
LEWVNIRLLTRRRYWTDPQRRMMRKAAVRNLFRVGLILFIGLAARLGIEGYRYLHAPALVEQLRTAKTEDVEGIINELAFCRRWANPRLLHVLSETSPSNKEHLHASLALLTVDTTQVDYLYARMLDAPRDELRVIMKALRPHKSQLIPKLWSILDSTKPGTEFWRTPPAPLPLPEASPSPPPPPPSTSPVPHHDDPGKIPPESPSESPSVSAHPASPGAAGPGFGGGMGAVAGLGPIGLEESLILRVATVLAYLDPDGQGWDKVTSKVSNELVKVNPLVLAYWVDALRPIKGRLAGALATASTDKMRPEIERIVADVIHGDYYGYGGFPMIGD